MKLFTYLTNYFERKARRDVLDQLRSMPERQLLDCGFSPDLLEEGVVAWPWRVPTEPTKPLRFNCNLDNASDYNALPGQAERISDSTDEKDTVSREAAA